MGWIHVRKANNLIAHIQTLDLTSNVNSNPSGWTQIGMTFSDHNAIFKSSGNRWISWYRIDFSLFKGEQVFWSIVIKPTASNAADIVGFYNISGVRIMGFYTDSSLNVYWANENGVSTKVGTATVNNWFQYKFTQTLSKDVLNMYYYTYGNGSQFTGEMDLNGTGLGALRPPYLGGGCF